MLKLSLLSPASHPQQPCYSHVLRSLQPDVITTVRDLVCTVTPDTLNTYAYLKHVLLSRYTSTADSIQALA